MQYSAHVEKSITLKLTVLCFQVSSSTCPWYVVSEDLCQSTTASRKCHVNCDQ